MIAGSSAFVSQGIVNLDRQTQASGQALERLSSGLKINRGADDPSGLAISSRIQATLRGLQTANQNAQDTMSFLQLRDGAMEEAHSVLMRLRDLAVRASNDATLTDADRRKMSDEAAYLVRQLDQMNAATKFNGKRVFDKAPLTVPAGDDLTLWQPGQRIASVDLSSYGNSVTIKARWYDGVAAFPDMDLISPDGTEGFGWMFDFRQFVGAAQYENYDVSAGATVNRGDPATDAGTDDVPAGATMDSADRITYNGATSSPEEVFTIDNPAPGLWKIVVDNENALSHTYGIAINDENPDAFYGAVTHIGPGSNPGVFELDVDKFEICSTAMALNVSFLTGDGARQSIDSIDGAIRYISGKRANDGVEKKRLEQIINNNTSEYIGSSEGVSRIRDADMAEEITQMTKSRITSQSATSAIAHADTVPGVVSAMLHTIVDQRQF